MKPLKSILMLALTATAFLFGPSNASADPPSPVTVARLARAEIIVPTEWDGIWTSTDSVYTCAGVPQSTSAHTDTVCGGKDFSPTSQSSPITFNCTGSANATSFDVTCTATSDVFTDCTANYNFVMHGTLSGSTSYIVSTINVTYSGTGAGCSLLPPSCTQSNSRGTRVAPAPPAYCTTATRQSSWGQVKLIYR
jgi:hypothetical protein